MQLSFRGRRKERQICAVPLQTLHRYLFGVPRSKEQYQQLIRMPLKRKFLFDSFILKNLEFMSRQWQSERVVCYFHHHWDQMPNKKQLKGAEFILPPSSKNSPSYLEKVWWDHTTTSATLLGEPWSRVWWGSGKTSLFHHNDPLNDTYLKHFRCCTTSWGHLKKNLFINSNFIN